VNKIDPWGLLDTSLYIPDEGKPHYDMAQTRGIIDYATWWVALHGPFKAHGAGGRFDYKVQPRPRLRFRLRDNEIVVGSEFGNYLTGYTCYYNYGLLGTFGARTSGEFYGYLGEFRGRSFSDQRRLFWEYGSFDDWGSKYWIMRGSLEAHIDRSEKLYPYGLRRMNPFNQIVEHMLRHDMLMFQWFGYIDGTSP
jgi:hypothetical protein